MRRKDRELMPEEAWEIVDRCADGVVSMVDKVYRILDRVSVYLS